MKCRYLITLLASIIWCSALHAREGEIPKATSDLRKAFCAKVTTAEIQLLQPSEEGAYIVLKTVALDAAKAKALVQEFRELPFERVTLGQCHAPGYAIRFFDTDKKLLIEFTLCWKCHNLRATNKTSPEFQTYEEDFASESKAGIAFQMYLQKYFPEAK